jgi:proteasome lid subunit RPN8/RPN11
VNADGLTIPASMAEALVAHARSELPNEACGLLAGNAAAGVASAFHPARNARSSPYRFDVAAEDLVRILHAIEADRLELIAVFHSHPASAADPSPTDVREARYSVVQLIASLQDPAKALRAWRIAGATCREVTLRIV